MLDPCVEPVYHSSLGLIGLLKADPEELTLIGWLKRLKADPEELTIEAVKMIPLLDLADEAGRKALVNVVTAILLEGNEVVFSHV